MCVAPPLLSHTHTSHTCKCSSIVLLLLGAKVQTDAEGRGRVSAEALSCTGTFASRIELFLSTLVYFCSGTGCPMPRFLTTNRSSGRAFGFLQASDTSSHFIWLTLPISKRKYLEYFLFLLGGFLSPGRSSGATSTTQDAKPSHRVSSMPD